MTHIKRIILLHSCLSLFSVGCTTMGKGTWSWGLGLGLGLGLSGGACIIIAVYAEPGPVPVEKVCSTEKTILSEVAFEKLKFPFC